MQVNTRLQVTAAAALLSAVVFAGCSKGLKVDASGAQSAPAAVPVGVTPVVRRSIVRQLTVSSELVPFQEIDLYAKESGYIKELLVD